MRTNSVMVASLLLLASAAGAQYPAPLQQGAPPPRTAAEAVAALKAHYFSQDFAGGDEAGIEATRRFPASAELRAWHVVNMARVGEREDSALAAADSLVKRYPQSVWSTFARSFAVSYQNKHDDAVKLARRVRARMPWNRDAVWLHGYVLHRAEKYKETISLADSAAKRVGAWGELLVLKANATNALANATPPDTTARARARAIFAEARRTEPRNINAMYLAAANTSTGPTDTLAFGLLRRASEGTPSIAVHRRYWDAVRARRDMTAAHKDSLMTADIERLLRERPHSAAVQGAAHSAFDDMKNAEKRGEIEARLRAEHPNSIELEWVDYNNLQTLRDSVSKKQIDTVQGMTRWKQRVNELVARPVHRHSGIYGTLLLWQFDSLVEDSTVSADSLKRFGEQLVKYNTANPRYTHMELPLLVAERKGDFRWAEKLVMKGDTIARERLERSKDRIVKDEGVGGYADALDYIKGQYHSALGWIYLHEGRLDDAKRELEKAREISRRDPRVYFHLGRLAEARGDSAEAQAMYARGLPHERFWTGRRNADALKRMYAAMNGNLDGYDAYVERLKEEDRQRRKGEIAKNRLTDGQAIPAFSLERYGAKGARVTNDSLKGKIAVVNFWGVWCGPCVKEIPDIQKFHETVKSDTAVIFITVDYNDTPEALHDFMTQKKLDFPVVLDENRWASDKAQVTAYPTTWFVDRDGRLVWKHVGASDVVLEEFLWRVEMLKSGTQPLKP